MSRHARRTRSERVYGLLIHLYPTSFHREFRRELIQGFRDLQRDAALRGPGRGLARLWGRTAVDLALSVPICYSRLGRGPMRKLTIVAAALYVTVLLGGVGGGALGYGEFYQRPAFNSVASPEASEAEREAAYEAALEGPAGSYRVFARAVAIASAILLGVSTGLFGAWQRSLWRGALAFGVAVGATFAALAMMPWIYFPDDRYAVAATWVMGGGPLIAALCWGIAMVGGRWFGVQESRAPAVPVS